MVIFGKYSLPCPTPVLPSMTYKASHVPTLNCKSMKAQTLSVLLTVYLLCPAQYRAHSRPFVSFGELMSNLFA